VEIIISGKLRTERARYEKFKEGYIPKSGEPALRNLRKAELHVQLKPGIFGIKVRIMPPDAKFPDQIQILEVVPPEVSEPPEKAEGTETSEAKTSDVEEAAEEETATEEKPQEPTK